MFNGIIKNTGKINKILKKNKSCIIEIKSNMRFNKRELGQSIACSGACLSQDKFNKKNVTFFISKETLDKTKNPVFKNAEASYFFAYKQGRIVGRIAVILNHIEINELGKKKVSN